MIICLAGMHRSGTSLMASYLQRCGIFMGERMAAPGPGNPRGHFEDRDFLDLNKAILKDNHASPFAVPVRLSVRQERKDQAMRLIEQRKAEYADWGWKDPRSSLLLDFWHELVPESKFVFLYREPLLMLDSLYRRPGDRALYFLFWRAGSSWIRYNDDLLKFSDRHPSACIFLNITAFNADPDRGREVLGGFLGRPLDAPYSSVYQPGAIRVVKEGRIHPMVRLNQIFLGSSMAAMYAQLEARSAFPENGHAR